MLLFTPGPTPVPEYARLAMGEPTLHHRTPEFEEIFRKTRVLLKELFAMDEVLLLASSGTGAMEAAVTHLCHKKALTINAGKFGERFSKICQAHHIPYHELTYEWDTPASVAEITDAITKDPAIDAVFLQACESAGGLRHPAEQIAQAVKQINSDISVIVDGITTVGVEPVATQHIDALICGSQKALMLPPGLAMLGLSPEAQKKIEAKPFGYYFNLKSELKKQKENTTAYTAATTLIIGLLRVLEELKKEGFEALYHQTHKRAVATRFALQGIGLDLYPRSPALAMSTVYGDTADKVRSLLKKKYNVHLAGGQDRLKGKIFRINHMGVIPVHEAVWVLNAIELALDEMGVRTFDGSASRFFCEVYFK